MEKSKRKMSKKTILIAILILLIGIIAILGGGSFSKYVAQVEGSGVMQVAKWAFSVNGQTKTITNIDLMKTYDAKTLTNKRIAPGTSGSFNIEIDATGSEVGVDYDVAFAESKNAPKNLVFSCGNITSNSLVSLGESISGTINADDEEKTKTITINWEWPYETGRNEGKTEEEIEIQDEEDTEDGKNLGNYTATVIITGSQVEPQA